MGLRAWGEGVLWLGVKGGGKSLIATYPENLVLTSQLEVCQEGGGQEGEYLEDNEGSRPETEVRVIPDVMNDGFTLKKIG